MRRARRGLAAALVVVGVVVGAGPVVAAGSKRGCPVRKGDVTEAIGVPVTRGPRPEAPESARVCEFEVTGKRGSNVIVWVQDDRNTTRDYRTAKALAHENLDELRSLGRRAFYARDLLTAYVLRDGTLVSVQYADLDVEAGAVKRAVVALTRIVLDRVE